MAGHAFKIDNMKKFFLLAFASALTLIASAQTFEAGSFKSEYIAFPASASPMADDGDSQYVPWGYCIDNIQYSIGVNEECTMSAAILINRDDMKDYRNAEIAGIRIGVADLSKNISVFMKTGNADNISFDLPDVVKKNVGNKGMGFHDVLFDSPRRVTDDFIIIGYTSTGKNNIGYDGATSYPDACYLCLNGEWGTLYDVAAKNGWGSSCIQLLLSGDDLPEREMKLEKIFTKNVEQNKDFELTGTVTNMTRTPVTNYQLSYSVNNGKTYTQTIECNIGAMQTDTFSLAIQEPLKKIGSNAIMVKIDTVNGEEDADISNNVIIHSINCIEEGCYFKRAMVLEESTSVYCGYCPKGIVVMRSLKERYPDRFIGIAIHSSAMGSDPMVVYDYDEEINSIYSSSGLPNCIMNRLSDYQGDPLKIELDLDEILDKFELADANIWFKSVSDLVDDKINVSVNARFAKNRDRANYRIAFVLLENQVKSNVPQLNYFSGGGSDGGMGGFENLPKYVDMPFDDVARGIWDFDGIGGSLPETIVKKEVYEYETTLNLKDKKAIYQNKNNLEVVAMIIDFYTGEIVNAAKTTLNSSTDVECIGSNDVFAVAEGGRINVYGQYDNIEVFNLNGMTVANEGLENGIYIARITVGNNVVVRKVVVR